MRADSARVSLKVAYSAASPTTRDRADPVPPPPFGGSEQFNWLHLIKCEMMLTMIIDMDYELRSNLEKPSSLRRESNGQIRSLSAVNALLTLRQYTLERYRRSNYILKKMKFEFGWWIARVK